VGKIIMSDKLYCIDFPDGSCVNVVSDSPVASEVDEATVAAVKNMMTSFPGAKAVGSVSEIK
jgi:hypothetical protein